MSVLIKDTTEAERQKIVKDAIALSSLDAIPPTDKALALYQKYIKGEMELSEITQTLISSYNQHD